MRIRLLLPIAFLACAGGQGALSDDLDTWDRGAVGERASPSTDRVFVSNERAGRSTEPAARSLESAPGLSAGPQPGGVLGLDCSGTYTCQELGDDDTDRVSAFAGTNGTCVLDQRTLLEPDGRVTQNGRVVGSWTITASGFAVTTTEGSVTCTRATTSNGSNGSGSDSSPPSAQDAGTAR